MKIRISVAAQLGLFAVAILYSLYIAGQMPDIVPIHWGFNGKPDGYGPKWMNLLIMPGVILLMVVLTPLLPKISPRKFQMDTFEDTYGYSMFLCGALMLAIHVLIVQASSGHHVDILQGMMFIMFAFFALLGNVIGKIKRNFFMGIRTPWTLSDERVWHATHRYAGRLWLFGGTVGSIATVFGTPFSLEIVYFMVIAFLPVIQSYRIYQRLGVG